MYLDIHKLLHGKKEEITHKFVKRWKDFNSLSSFADKTEDIALINKIKVGCSIMFLCIYCYPAAIGSVGQSLILSYVHDIRL